MNAEKIDGFKFAFGLPLMPNFIVNGKYELIGPQPPKQANMMGPPGMKKTS
jgi:hypothetical protein